ncbi:glycoside hydrolase family 15 protein [Candidatus Halobonum tyrrellensis]|uniref:Glycosyl hydrolase, glucoamylase n=1 Tax=Candidatus Halobonum tyrrellensis G22 TaxID=1324957 RepID=V4HKB2_9EURY|nr:glycoside hydrolase family 15 protein [Candidatus Halobonum tyrrellensis]ESP90223.1 glycosyl hydrolase, glucoamylase [Candidatus Halobonum tyrrellensis G22]
METPDYPPLSDYGVIGDQTTCALVNRHGSVDWWCLPHLESPSAFGAVLDAEQGGRFRIRPVYPYQSAQTYVERTNVLRTDFYGATGRAALTDWMPFPGPEESLEESNALYRKLECLDGPLRFDVTFDPRFEYGRERPDLRETDRGVVATGDAEAVHLAAPPSLAVDGLGDDGADATLSLDEGETAWFVVRDRRGDAGFDHDPASFESRLESTVDAWRGWLSEGGRQSGRIDDGQWERLVDRSALALKLLIHESTDAIAAAPTTSLPEEIGGSRNWDYRYSWIRDAALTVQALSKLGHADEASAYFSWLISKVYDSPESIRPLYGLHGDASVEEYTLDHLEGYRRSSPVRVGNAAEAQRQLDVYGELVLALYETTRFGETLGDEAWTAVREVVDHVVEVWDEPDAGIWEVRSEPRQFVHSKVMCWVALDRGVKLVEDAGFDGPVDRWRRAREEVRETVLDRGYSEEAGSFVRSFETTEALDATALLFPLYGFLPFDDPRVEGTIAAVRDRLTTDAGLVYRYEGEDGLPGGEGTFVLCSFWLVDALALSGRVDEAEALFGEVLARTGPLGLLSEEIAAESGALLGNYPQAFSHIGLINSVLYLDRARENRQPGPEPLGAESARGTLGSDGS